jgi:molybdenum cofactor synthesis domain-containing protein
MDGFAVISSDLPSQKGRAKLSVVGESKPESIGRLKIGHGEAVRVSTGSRIPDGADAVIPVEDVKEEAGGIVIGSKVAPGAFVYKAGTDFRKGDVLLRKNSRIRAQDVGLLLTLGLDKVEAVGIPTVAILATGSELYNLGEDVPGKVLNAHGPLFADMARAAACSPVDMGVLPDDMKVLSKGIRDALNKADLVLTLGGTSVGRRDLVPEVVKGFSPEVFYHGLRMDRGRVAGVAVVGGKPLVMLPGPVQGAMNAYFLLGVPIIDRLRGGGSSILRFKAKMSKPWKARRRFQNFTKVAYVRLDEKGLNAEPLEGETESIAILTKASGFVVVPEEVTEMSRGDPVDVNLLPGFSYAP